MDFKTFYALLEQHLVILKQLPVILRKLDDRLTSHEDKIGRRTTQADLTVLHSLLGGRLDKLERRCDAMAEAVDTLNRKKK
jgi:hypothetical protein